VTTAEPAASAAAPVFSALGDATRLGIVARLGTSPSLSVTELTRGAGLTRQGVSKHLGVLEAAGVVARRRVGREARFELRPAPLAEARAYLDHVAAQWDDAIARLRAFVEEPGA
jgi:DNA-binding transcriptional ArsR family regulator